MDDQTLLDLFGSLSRELASFRQDVNQGFGRVEARLARQGGIINGGARQVTRLIQWSEEIDQMLIERDALISELRTRIEKLEGRNGK